MASHKKVFIQANNKQLLGAYLSKFSILENSHHLNEEDINIMHVEDYPHLFEREGESYIRKGVNVRWQKDDLQSFTLTRFLPPSLMDFSGKAVVIDPDIFAVNQTDILDIFEAAEERPISCYHENQGGEIINCRTSVMVLNCEQLKHWDWEQLVDDLFNKKIDYRELMSLHLEPKGNIGLLPIEWNHYDTLNKDTKLIHFTKRTTQPWKTGLKVDFKHDPAPSRIPLLNTRHTLALKRLFFPWKYQNHYLENPFPDQIHEFTNLLQRALNQDFISSSFIKKQISEGHIRKDIFYLINNQRSENSI